MSRVFLIISLTALGFSLSKSATVSSESKTKDVDVTSSETAAAAEASEDQDIMNELIESMDKCNETFRTEMAYLVALNNSGSFPDETDKTPKCYVRCVLELMEIASEDGEYDPARTALVFGGKRSGKEMDDVEEIATGCTDRKESCKCDRAYQYMKCIMETEIKRYEST